MKEEKKDAAHWQRIKNVLYEAIELPPEERTLFLEDACDNRAMRAEVEALLDAHVEAAGFMDTPPSLLNDLPGLFEPLSDVDQERVIGPYRLLHLVGQGGMGDVYLAERADGLFEQQVALKLVRYQDTEAVLRRFEAERRILASLQHHNIARLLDGGTTEAGRPYFVMEYVDGQSLITYAEAQNLSLEARIRLIVAVGQAVQHAHRNLIVHRDLKPSNILVSKDEDGAAQVKLLDFGIAKLLHDDDEQNVLTESGARLMTRAYAAPEQIQGESITTATDVYALGAVLYELLTSHRIFEAATPHNLERAILEDKPTLPSVAVLRKKPDENESTGGPAAKPGDAAKSGDVAGRAKKLRGDLDVVCLKAVSKEPAERYASMEAFVADLKRYLVGLPVEAQPPSKAYQVRKFVQRHRAGTIAAAFVLTLITMFGIAIMLQQAETTRQRDRAELELAKSETVTDFLLDLFSANRPSEARGDTITARELLVRGQDRLESLEEQPEIRALMKEHIGRIYRNLGEYDKALPLMEEALAERRQVLGENHEDVASSLAHLATLLTDQGEYENALELSLQALSMRQSLFVDGHPIIASNLSQLAVLNKHLGRYEEAEERFRELLKLVQSLYSPDDMRISSVHNNFGRLLDEMLDYEGSFDQYKLALIINSQHLEPDHPDILITKNNLGMALYRLKRYEEAVEQLDEVVSLRRKVLGNAHPGLATSLSTLGAVLMAKADNALAIEHFQEAEDIYRNAFGSEHPSVATVKYNSARASHNLEDWEVAESSYRQALQIRTKALGENHPRVAFIEMYLGRLLHDMENYTEAEMLYLKVFSVFDQQFANDNRSVVLIREWLVDLYEVQGRMEEAARYKMEETVDQSDVG